MACSACQSHVEAAVRELNGVKTVQVSLLEKTLLAAYDPETVTPEQIMQAVTDIGFTIQPFQEVSSSKRLRMHLAGLPP